MAIARHNLLALLALLTALLLAGCSGGGGTKDTDGDGDSDQVEGGGQIEDDEDDGDDDIPGFGWLAAIGAVLGVGAFLARRKA